MGIARFNSVPGLVAPSPWRLVWARALCNRRSAVAGLICSSSRRVWASSCSSPWRSKALTNSSMEGTSRLAQMQFAVRHTCTKATESEEMA